jgi:hypothetical protein
MYMSYDIKDYSFKQAAKLGVDIKPSKKKNKKIDVIKDNLVIASIGDKRYSDYPSYLEDKGKKYAEERRRLYKIRHAKDLGKKNSPGYYANKILW